MVSIKQDFLIAIINSCIHFPETFFQTERTRILYGFYSDIISLLEIPSRIMSIRIGPLTFRISRNIVRILQPPCISQISFWQIKTSHCFSQTTRHTRIVRQILNSCNQIRENDFSINFRYRITHGRAWRSNVESQLTRAQVQGYTTESLSQQEIVHGTEETRFGYQRFWYTHFSAISNHTVASIDISKCHTP